VFCLLALLLAAAAAAAAERRGINKMARRLRRWLFSAVPNC
jgi:hypothetical protein